MDFNKIKNVFLIDNKSYDIQELKGGKITLISEYKSANFLSKDEYDKTSKMILLTDGLVTDINKNECIINNKRNKSKKTKIETENIYIEDYNYIIVMTLGIVNNVFVSDYIKDTTIYIKDENNYMALKEARNLLKILQINKYYISSMDFNIENESENIYCLKRN